MRCMCSGAMPEPVSEMSTATCPLACGGDAQRAAGRHGVLGVQEQIEKDLLQFAGVAQNRRQIRLRAKFPVAPARPELMFQQLQRVLE